jgi:hypothetical protein
VVGLADTPQVVGDGHLDHPDREEVMARRGRKAKVEKWGRRVIRDVHTRRPHSFPDGSKDSVCGYATVEGKSVMIRRYPEHPMLWHVFESGRDDWRPYKRSEDPALKEWRGMFGGSL